MINIYIESNFKGVKGKAEYGYVLEWEKNGEVRKNLGPELLTIDDTRNRAYIKTLIHALRRIYVKEPVRVYATNGYLISSMEKELPKFWFMQNWMKGNGEKVCNCDLWRELLEVIWEKEFENMEWFGGTHNNSEKIIRKIEKQYEVEVRTALVK